MYSFHVPIMLSSATTKSEGFESGTIILKNMVNWLAPSIVAASSSALCIPRTKPAIINTEKGMPCIAYITESHTSESVILIESAK